MVERRCLRRFREHEVVCGDARRVEQDDGEVGIAAIGVPENDRDGAVDTPSAGMAVYRSRAHALLR